MSLEHLHKAAKWALIIKYFALIGAAGCTGLAIKEDLRLLVWAVLFGFVVFGAAKVHGIIEGIIATDTKGGEPLALVQQVVNDTLKHAKRIARANEIVTALNRQSSYDSERREMVRVLQQFAECDLNDANCASLEVASKRIRNIANAALAKMGELPH